MYGRCCSNYFVYFGFFVMYKNNCCDAKFWGKDKSVRRNNRNYFILNFIIIFIKYVKIESKVNIFVVRILKK